MFPEIIYEDTYFLAVNKPAGLICSPDNFPALFLIHRLDRETSGVLLLAKNAVVLESFQNIFRTRRIQKTYLGLFWGRVSTQAIKRAEVLVKQGISFTQVTKMRGVIDAPIKRIPKSRERFGVIAGGRPSQTGFKVLRYFSYQDQYLSFVEAVPFSGRTHQIRVHFSSLGWPLVGDKFYGPRKFEKLPEFNVRQLLHAKSVVFRHPLTGQALKIEAALPDDFKTVLKFLKKFKYAQ